MNIIILEDNDTKFSHIEKYLFKNRITNITREKSYNGMLDNITNAIKLGVPYDLAILDTIIPKGDVSPDKNNILYNGGVRLFRKIRKLGISIPVMFCTSEDVRFGEDEESAPVIKYNQNSCFDKFFDRVINSLKGEESDYGTK